MIRKLLCKIGFHKWGKWKISKFQALSASDLEGYSYTRICECCNEINYQHFEAANRP